MRRRPIEAGGYVKDGRIVLDNRVLLKAALSKWDGRIRITIEQEEQTRRQKQNRYYFGVCLKFIAEETGHSVDDLHEYFKLRFNGKTIEVEGEEKRIALTTTKLTVTGFCDYVEMVKVWAAEFLGVLIPEADPEYWRKEDTA